MNAGSFTFKFYDIHNPESVYPYDVSWSSLDVTYTISPNALKH